MNKNILILVTAFFLLSVGYFYKGNALSLPFVDEQDNFAIGKYLTKREILYDDILTNHQPATYIFSALVQQVKSSFTTFALLNTHRLAMIGWSFVWSLILVIFFGLAGLLFVIFYELTKNYLFGSLFLAEAMVVYPLVLATGMIFRKQLNKRILVLVGISLALAFFTLSPIWPTLFFLSALLIFKFKDNLRRKLSYLLIGILLVLIVISRYTSIPGYFQSLYINYAYTIPQYHDGGGQETWVKTILKSFATPVFSFTRTDTTPILWFIRLLSVLFVINIVLLISQGKKRQALILFLLLGFSNIRFVYPGESGYQGFHLLPWYSLLIFIVVIFSLEQVKQNTNKKAKATILVILITALFFSLKYAGEALFINKDLQKEYTINYSTHTDIGRIINIMKSPQDTLFVSPNAWLVYWQSDTNHLPKLYGYYAWISGVPEYHQKTLEAFKKSPPTFFFCQNCGGLDLGEFLYKYQEVKKNGGQTGLFVLPERLRSQSKTQLDQLKFYGID